MTVKHRISAYWDLLKHYRTVFAYFWTRRKLMHTGLFNEQEADFLPAALSLQEKPISTTAKLTGRLLMLFVMVAVVWSILGHIDIIVNATGKIVPSGRTKTIASVDVASVKALHVQEGMPVKAGDLLIELDTSATDTEHDKAVGDASVALLQVARSKALIIAVDSLHPQHLAPIAGISGDQLRIEQSHLDGQYHDFMAKLSRTEGDIQRYGSALPLATQQAADYLALSKDGDVSVHAYLQKEQARIDLKGQLEDAKNQRSALITETKKDAEDALTEGNKDAESSQQDALRAGSHSKLLRLIAPVDGTVQQLTVNTVGGVVPAAQALMQIVPNEKQVEVEAFLENKDVGFVREGQEAEVKVDAYEYTKYGTIPAHVSHVSRDAIQDDKKGLIYSVKVTLDRPDINVDGKTMPLSAGLSVTVDIKTGTRRVIEYILSPLMQYQHEGLHER
jgi:hemolysin D